MEEMRYNSAYSELRRQRGEWSVLSLAALFLEKEHPVPTEEKAG